MTRVRGRGVRRGVWLDLPSPCASWACRIWSRNAFRDLVDLLGSCSAAHEQQKEQKEKTIRKEKTLLRRPPGFYGAERPAVADIHILCHVFKHIPWSPAVELHLRLRNFGLTTQQVLLILDKLKDNLSHTINFFIWADQQRGHYHTAECFEMLKGAMNAHLDNLHPMLKDMEANGRFVPLHVLILAMEVFVEKNMVQLAFEVFQSLTKFGSRPDEDAYNMMLQALLDAGYIDMGIEVFEQMKKDKWCSPGNTTLSLFLWGLGKAGKVAEARRLLEKLKSSNHSSLVEAHNELVSGLCEGNWMDYAEEAVIEMYEQGLEPSTNVYTSLISGNTRAGRMTEAYTYYADAVKDKLVTPSMDLLTMLIKGFCRQNDPEAAEKLLKEMGSAGFPPDALLYAAVIQCISKQDKWRAGPLLSDTLQKQGVNLDADFYNTAIKSCIDGGHMEIALSLVCQMVREDHICPQEVTFSALFLRLVELNKLEYWRKLLFAMEGLKEDLQASFSRMLVVILANADKVVSKHVMDLMTERGLYQP
ncbi:hypothetical protein L7F22_027747 [Adiantum nelumboides]|nr:hypothetical protein [Adiantum nelumboides]